MSELKPCDFLGNEIRMGDEVAFFALGYRMFTRGIVVRITPKCLFIDYDNSWNYDHHEEHTRQEQKQVIDLTALNRRTQPANEPLTLEQLWEMDGEPVYIVTLESQLENPPYWAIVGISKNDSRYQGGVTLYNKTQGDWGSIELYGKTWLAYRHKPKGEHHEAD